MVVGFFVCMGFFVCVSSIGLFRHFAVGAGGDITSVFFEQAHFTIAMEAELPLPRNLGVLRYM